MRCALFALTLLAAAPTALAQPPLPPAGDEPLRAQVAAHVRKVALEKLTRLLQLDGPTANRVAAVTEQYEARMAPVRQKLRRERGDLVTLVHSGAGSDANVNRLVDAMLADREALRVIESERGREVRKVLTPTQFAQLVLAMPMIKLEMQRAIRQAIRARRGGGGQPPPLDGDPDND
jgi:Spy/CpxP family protein refolding chaperone